MHNANPVLLLGKAIWLSYRTFRGNCRFPPGSGLPRLVFHVSGRSSGSHFSGTGSARFSPAGTTCSWLLAVCTTVSTY